MKKKPIVDSCAFLPCDQVERCALSRDGSCNMKKFPTRSGHQDTLKKGAPALVGKKPPRAAKKTR